MMNDFSGKDYNEKQKIIEKNNKKKARIMSTRLLTVIQITVCSIVLVAAVCIRFFTTNTYATIKNWYFENVNNSVIADEDIENVKHSVVELFSSGADLFSGDSVKVKSGTPAENTQSKASSSAQTQSNIQQVVH